MAADFKPCSIDGCNGNAAVKGTSRGWCSAHYRRWQRYGDPLLGGTPKGATLKFISDIILPYDGDECIIWPFSRTAEGYAELRKDGVRHIASRYICDIAHGPAPTPKHQAAHSCGKGHKGCVTKRHLRWATVSDNQMDRVEHGTSNRGQRHPHDKLTEDDVRAIRSLHNIVEQAELAGRFNVSRSTIQDIQYRNSWQWLE